MTDKKTGRAALEGLDIRLGDLFGNLGAALNEMIERLDAGSDGEIRQVHEFDTARGPIRAQAGIRVRMGGVEAAGGAGDRTRPAARTAPVEPRASAPSAPPSVRPVQAEIINDGEVWRLTADLPGVTREDLALSITDGELVIAAEARNRRYADRVTVPAGTKVKDLRVSLQNGILEIEVSSASGARS